jgi:4-hydroxybenzoate polyprenyltransferase
MGKLQAYITIARPANVLSSAADVIGGALIATAAIEWLDDTSLLLKAFMLVLSTACLYAGGIVFNDVYDYDIDRIERPERVLPSGKLTMKEAKRFGAGLFILGVFFALLVSFSSAVLALCIVLAAFTYDAKAKHSVIYGPLMMGICRGLNMLLGISILSNSIIQHVYLAFVPFFYIIGITLISTCETGRIKKNILDAGCFFYLLACSGLIAILYIKGLSLMSILPFLLGFLILTLIPLIKMQMKVNYGIIRQAVKNGVIGIVLLDATMAAGYAGPEWALIILVLLPLSMALSRYFAVT